MLTYFLQRLIKFLAHGSTSLEASLGNSHLPPKTWRERNPSRVTTKQARALQPTLSHSGAWAAGFYQSALRVYISTSAKDTRVGSQILVFLSL